MMLLLGVALAGGAAFIVPGHAPQLAVRRTEGTAVLPPRALPTASITGRDGVKTGVVSGTIQEIKKRQSAEATRSIAFFFPATVLMSYLFYTELTSWTALDTLLCGPR